MIKMVTPTPIFPLFLLSKGNSIWLPRWPKSKPMGHELARGTKKLVKFSTSGFQKCDLKKCIMRVLVSPPFLPYYIPMFSFFLQESCLTITVFGVSRQSH